MLEGSSHEGSFLLLGALLSRFGTLVGIVTLFSAVVASYLLDRSLRAAFAMALPMVGLSVPSLVLATLVVGEERGLARLLVEAVDIETKANLFCLELVHQVVIFDLFVDRSFDDFDGSNGAVGFLDVEGGILSPMALSDVQLTANAGVLGTKSLHEDSSSFGPRDVGATEFQLFYHSGNLCRKLGNRRLVLSNTVE